MEIPFPTYGKWSPDSAYGLLSRRRPPSDGWQGLIESGIPLFSPIVSIEHIERRPLIKGANHMSEFVDSCQEVALGDFLLCQMHACWK